MDHKSFWTSLPGILTGVASLITASVGMIAVVGHKSAEAPAPKASAAVFAPAIAPTVHVSKPHGCNGMIGQWSWFIGGVVTLNADGSLIWKKEASDSFPTAGGVWSCVDAKTNTATLSWPNGFVDTVTLAADGKSVAGTTTASPTVKVTGWKL